MKAIISSVLSAAILSSCVSQNDKHTVDYKQGNTLLEGYLVKPTTHKAPGIVIIHAWMGITDHEKNTADRLGALGYYALDADIYGKGIHPKDAKEAGQLAKQYEGKDYQTYLARIQAAVNEIIKQGADANKIVVIGYCFGGFGAISAARNNFPIKGIVSFHGALLPDPSGSAASINPKLLICHGNNDPFQPANADVNFRKEMETRNADYQMDYFGHAVHSFTDKSAGNDNSKGAAYNEKADKRSWQYMLEFLKEVFAQ
ncbi:MAG: dienelactone hydrolase family protein [Arachidicoccus sp.]|nr:dienelactone hydrolase family protein [Arachidicoccus sp.]